MPRHTSLHDTHLALGARIADFAGWDMPLRYDSESAEHQAVRTAAGLFDLGHMGQIEVTGPQATAALDYALVSDIVAIAVGKAKYTVICRTDGGMVDDLIVYRLAAEHYLVVANAANTCAVHDALRARADGFAVQVRDRGADRALLAVQGPRAAAVLAASTQADLSALRYYAISRATVAGREVLLARTGYTGEDGFEIFCSHSDAQPIWQALTTAGHDHGLVPAGLACRNTLRLEAGMPLYQHELRADLTPYSAGLGRLVQFERSADFVGRQALAAQADRPPARQLIGLVSAGRRVPRAGYAVLHPGAGTCIGQITSGAPSPTLGHPIAMAYVDTTAAAPGTPVAVDIRGRAEPAHLVELPFYRRHR